MSDTELSQICYIPMCYETSDRLLPPSKGTSLSVAGNGTVQGARFRKPMADEAHTVDRVIVVTSTMAGHHR